ncbi:hypothetical protein FRC00_005424 [Tulasnella sp. 408]|nr:hypothetical protein FRC00_005424 [Tulasnella sp. 408]
MSQENGQAASATLPPATSSVNDVALNGPSSPLDPDIHVQLPSTNYPMELADGFKYFGATGKSVAREPNRIHLVFGVSITEAKLYTQGNVPAPNRRPQKNHPSGSPLRVVAVDDDAFTAETYDDLFISNGPGDPTMHETTITRLRGVLSFPNDELKPAFGYLPRPPTPRLRRRLTRKMKYGNRGHNIPCQDVFSGRCYITSQNHGFEVDKTTLPAGWMGLFKNANDGSNGGIIFNSGALGRV